jgi:hypothetical protein
MIDIQIYNDKESENVKKFPNYLLQAFSPVTFTAINYKSTVDSESELWKYADTMKEFTFEGNIKCLQGIVTEHEKVILQKVLIDLKFFLNDKLGLKIDGRNCLSGSLISHAYINRISENLKKKITVMEFGPGTGYLGLLLAEEGYSYYSTDISQAFYIYQNHLYSEVLGDKFIEGVLTSNLDPIPGSIVHVPWWKWVDNNVDLPPIDIAVFNHCLVEMHPNALKYALTKLKNLRKNKLDDSPLLIFIEGFGHEGYRKSHDIVNIFYEMGFELVQNSPIQRSSDKCDVSVLALFEYKPEKKVNPYRTFPCIDLINKDSAIRTFKCIVKYILATPFEKRYQKNKYVNLSNYFYVNQNLINANIIKKIFINSSDNKEITMDEEFLIYCNGDV